jgi:oxygen-dependent protoporphyrinogen oxidase
LVEFERRRGSIALGALFHALGGGESGLSGTYSARQGLGGLAELLAREVRGDVALGTRVEALERKGSRWQLQLASSRGEQQVVAGSVVLATDALTAARLIAPLDEEAAALVASVEYAPIASLALSVDPAAAVAPIEGFGFLVPRDQGLDLLGALFMSRLFPGRAPPERELVTAMMGGTGWPGVVDADDDELLKRALEGLDRGLGLGSAEIVGVSRWPRAVPQPGPDHPARVASLRRRLAALPGLALAGCYLDGVGVADTLACGARVGQELAL